MQSLPAHALHQAHQAQDSSPCRLHHLLKKASQGLLVKLKGGWPSLSAFPNIIFAVSCRAMTAKVHIIRETEGNEDALLAFRQHLLEEPEKRRDGQPGFPGMVAFLDELQSEVFEYMQEEAQA